MENVNSTNTNDHEMEDIEFSSAFSKDANKKVSITLHPTIFQPIERFEDNGHEIPEPKLTEKEEFQRSVQLLESTYRSVKKMKTSVEGNDSTDAKEEKENEDKDNEEDLSWMDPRIHYRPMVGALQNSQMELHQLIYLIDMIRGKSFLDETYCIREDVAPKEDELQLLIQMKAQQLKQAGKILQNGAASIKKAIEKERHFVADLLSILQQWKVCAPGHGSIPKLLRSGEPLAIDCSYTTAGSIFQPEKESVDKLAHAMLNRTLKGNAYASFPEAFVQKTLKCELFCKNTSMARSYTLPEKPLPKLSITHIEALGDSDEDQLTLQAYNKAIIHAVQHVVYCEEIFQTVMNETLKDEASWIQTIGFATQDSKYSTIQVNYVLDDELMIRIDEYRTLKIQLVNVEQVDDIDRHQTTSSISKEDQSDPNVQEWMDEACVHAMVVLQSQVRAYHGRLKNANARMQLFTEASAIPEDLTSLHNIYSKASPCVISKVASSTAHFLFKQEIASLVDDLSSSLAKGYESYSFVPRALPASKCQPLCDTIQGIYMKTKWKKSPCLALSAFDLYIGKYFHRELEIQDTQIRFSSAAVANSGPSTLELQETFRSSTAFRAKVIDLVLVQLTEALFREARAVNVTRVTMDIDHKTVRVYSAGAWDGAVINGQKESEHDHRGCLVLRPFVLSETGQVDIQCTMHNLGVIPELDAMINVSLDAAPETLSSGSGELQWKDIPGHTDGTKLHWLLHKTGIVALI